MDSMVDDILATYARDPNSRRLGQAEVVA
jgi:hypothetical protein